VGRHRSRRRRQDAPGLSAAKFTATYRVTRHHATCATPAALDLAPGRNNPVTLKKRKTASKWVFLMRAKQRKPGPPPYADLFLARDGTTTDAREHAATFTSGKAAIEFARRKGIPYSANQYPYQIDFDA